MGWKSQKSETKPNLDETTTVILPWHHGEPHQSWWLDKDRAEFSSTAKEEAPRIVASAMARRIYRQP